MLQIQYATMDDHTPNWHNRLELLRCHILVLITAGKVVYQLNRSELIASKGDLLFIPAGTYRSARNADDELHQKYAILFTVDSSLPDLPLLARKESFCRKIHSFQQMKERFQSLYRHSLEQKAYYEFIRIGILVELLGMTNRELDSPRLPKRKQQYVEQIEQYILEHVNQPVLLRTLAELVGRSPNYTAAIFKEVVGLTPLEYQNRLRISTAMDLLRTTRLTVEAIAEHLGYYDTSYFYKQFRKHTGKAPSEFRE